MTDWKIKTKLGERPAKKYEREILDAMAAGGEGKRIAEEQGLTVATVYNIAKAGGLKLTDMAPRGLARGNTHYQMLMRRVFTRMQQDPRIKAIRAEIYADESAQLLNASVRANMAAEDRTEQAPFTPFPPAKTG